LYARALSPFSFLSSQARWDDILPEEELSFEQFKPPPEEETADSIK
jgi:hypothetical protein